MADAPKPHEMPEHPTEYHHTGAPICGAKRRNGQICRAPAMANGRCRIHGGNTPKGIASPNWKNGKFSRYLPQGMNQLAWDAANDPNLFSLTELIGVYQARIQTALSELESAGGLSRLEALREAWGRFYTAWGSKDSAGVHNGVEELNTLFRGSGHDIFIWKDVDVAAINLKKLMESERKRRIEAHALIPTVKATDFALQLVLAVRAEVTDQATLARIESRVTDIIGGYPQVMKDQGE